MILVDAGVLISFLRTKDPKLDQLFRSRPVALCGVTRAEILAGARSANDRQKLLRFLSTFQRVVRKPCGTLSASPWHGSMPTASLSRSRMLWSPLWVSRTISRYGPHFPAMQKILPQLKLFQEPP